ncbi:hypothetical protein B0J13DRAFT_658569 [Dactylonectria estremocensis]|uniref:Uncharacterized protein n=1 Tax=Dactylonectria estremocensis TaxID=1079267 RepID=A0A9P9JB52_9HYPO|nr:hypothetical protein B0J13DRAFT_658569 [Dactylonectria estremocensis]
MEASVQWQELSTLKRVPLPHFEERWNALRTVSYGGDEETKLDMDPNPGNRSFSGGAGSSRVGGVDKRNMHDAMTASISERRIAVMAELFLETCPGEWVKLKGNSLRDLLRHAIDGDGDRKHDSDEVGDEIRDIPAIRKC